MLDNQRDFRLHTNALQTLTLLLLVCDRDLSFETFNLLHTVKLVICYSCDVSKMGGFADWSFCSFVVQPANVVLHIVHILQTVNMQNTPQVKGIDAQRCLFCKMLRSNDGEWFWNKGRQLHWCSHTPAPFFLKESETLHQVNDFGAILNAIDFRDIKFEFWMPPTSWRSGRRQDRALQCHSTSDFSRFLLQPGFIAQIQQWHCDSQLPGVMYFVNSKHINI